MDNQFLRIGDARVINRAHIVDVLFTKERTVSLEDGDEPQHLPPCLRLDLDVLDSRLSDYSDHSEINYAYQTITVTGEWAVRAWASLNGDINV